MAPAPGAASPFICSAPLYVPGPAYIPVASNVMVVSVASTFSLLGVAALLAFGYFALPRSTKQKVQSTLSCRGNKRTRNPVSGRGWEDVVKSPNLMHGFEMSEHADFRASTPPRTSFAAVPAYVMDPRAAGIPAMQSYPAVGMAMLPPGMVVAPPGFASNPGFAGHPDDGRMPLTRAPIRRSMMNVHGSHV
jgi:hypothetical protein